MATELELAELMAARLCHDLVGPIGAVANGVELLGDGGGPDPEVTSLIAASARQATRRLQWFRIAFGTANALPASSMLAETRRLAAGLFEDGRATLHWPPPDSASEAAATRPAAKLLLNLVLLGLESLPRGGTVNVQIGVRDGSMGIVVAASGTSARVPDDIQTALRRGVAISDLTPKSVPAYLAMRLAETTNAQLTIGAPGTDQVEFRVELRAAR
jgi:histidine phosphotransferase ChpT